MIRCSICNNLKVKFFTAKNSYKYYLCQQCKTLFLYSKSKLNTLKKYYEYDFEYTSGLFNRDRIKTRSKLILQMLKEINPEGKKLLDIGSGYGFLLELANNLGFKAVGIEPSKKLFYLSSRKNVKNITFEQYFKNRNKRKFDFITIIHVIEHISDPILWIKMASSLLNNKGVLYIETPNLSSHLFNFEKQNYTFLTPPDHLSIFSKKSFQTMIRKIPNLKIQKISTYSYPEHLMGIVKKIFRKMVLEKTETRNPESDSGQARMTSSLVQRIKYILFDKLFARLFTPLLNMGGYGSILELYFKKNP